MRNNVLVRVNGEQSGPFTTSELRALVRKGKFSLNDYVWSEDDDEWIKAEQLDEVRKLFYQETPGDNERKVMAIASGKGGVGKTIVTASLGVGLAALGKEVILVDADFGGANLHTCMGFLEPKYTFFDYYTMERENLEDIVLDSPISNLKLISGACGTLGIANPKYSQKQKLIRDLRNLRADYVILDLGAGTSLTVIDYFLAVDLGILLTTPEPMAIQEAFDFLKLCVLRKLQQTFRNEPDVLSLLDIGGFNQLTQLNAPMFELLDKARQVSPEIADRVIAELESFQPKLIMNMVMEPDEVREGMAIKTAAAELLSINVDYIGYIEYDETMRQTVKEMRPFLLSNPHSPASRSLARIITIKLLNKNRIAALLKNWQMRRTAHAQSENYPITALKESDIICSHKCFYWDDCEYQSGGMPCRVRHLEPLFKF